MWTNVTRTKSHESRNLGTLPPATNQETDKSGLGWGTKCADRSSRCAFKVYWISRQASVTGILTQSAEGTASRVMSTGTRERSRRPLVIKPCENKCRSLQLHRVPIPTEWRKGARGYPEASNQHEAPSTANKSYASRRYTLLVSVALIADPRTSRDTLRSWRRWNRNSWDCC